jgi:putative flippase GtrA
MLSNKTMRNNNQTSDWRREATYLTRYAGTGLINTIVGFVVILSAMAFGFSPLVSNIAGYAVGFTLGFVLSKKFVFRSNGHFVAESVRYLVAFVISFLFNLLVLRLALVYLNFNAVASQVAAAVSYTLLMYILTRLFVFDTMKTTKQNLNNKH